MSTFIWRPDPPPAVPARAGADAPIRLAVKDIVDMAGVVTTSGSKAVASESAPASADAACLAGARAAEAAGEVVIVGRTNLHELAFGVTGINPWYGTPVNPIDARRCPGGSSSGSAVAVATGEADIAIGTDTGGSIRIPAACCGVVGLKTTRGRVSLDGVRPLAPSLDTVGPMAATVELTARGMTLLEPGFTTAGSVPAARIGRFRPAADRAIDAAIDSALAAFAARAGATVVDIELPGWDAATHATMTIMSAEAWAVNADLWHRHRHDLSADVARRLELASLLGPEEVAAAWETARDWHRELSTRLAAVEMVALPVMAEPPPLLDDGGRLTEIRYVAPFNLAGVPALALPLAGGGPFPPSLQLVGPARSEAALLATGAVLEEVAGGRMAGHG